MNKIIYMPRMELVKDGSAIDVWQDWGIWEDEEKAIEFAKKLKQDIADGVWFDRECEGCTLEAAVEVIEENPWSLKEIIEV